MSEQSLNLFEAMVASHPEESDPAIIGVRHVASAEEAIEFFTGYADHFVDTGMATTRHEAIEEADDAIRMAARLLIHDEVQVDLFPWDLAYVEAATAVEIATTV